MFGTVALWLVPGSFWRPIALALLVQWAAAEAYYQLTDVRVPLLIYAVGDLAVIAAALLARSHWSDWLIIAVYPLVWVLYLQDHTRDQWIALYFIALAQFVLAGPWPQIQRALGSFSHGSSKRQGVQSVRGA